MYFFGNNFLLILLVILNLFASISPIIFPTTSDKTPKSVICVVEKGIINIQQVPLECTCLASYSSNKDTGPNDIQALRKDRDLQYLLIYDDYDYSKISNYLTSGSIAEFTDEICNKIQEFNANGVLFTRMNSNDADEATVGDPEGIFQQGVQQLFTELRKKHENILIGLCLTSIEYYLDHAFTHDFMDSYVDFFVANTIRYHLCVHENHQSDMVNIAPLQDIKDTLDMMISKGFTYDKLMFIIRVVVRSTTYQISDSKDDTSYADMCSPDHDFSKKRKFCVETLPNFYQKGLLVNDRGMKGVIVQSVDNDDFFPTCGTVKFPAMQAIKAGVDGKLEPLEITGEPNWAILARDRK